MSPRSLGSQLGRCTCTRKGGRDVNGFGRAPEPPPLLLFGIHAVARALLSGSGGGPAELDGPLERWVAAWAAARERDIPSHYAAAP